MPQSTQHPEYLKHQPMWTRCRDAYDGTDAIRAKGAIYLPLLSEQTQDEYKAYQNRAVFFGAMERTVQGLAGAAIHKPFDFKLPASLAYMEDDCTQTSMRLIEFIKWMVTEELVDGRLGILVDRPAVEPGGKEGNPYFVPYRAAQIINWDTENTPPQWYMLEECYYEEDETDPYRQAECKRWRELRLENGQYHVFIHTKKADAGTEAWETEEQPQPTLRGKPLEYIPFVVVNAGSIGVSCSKPPLLALVDINLSHYCNSADLEHGRHYCGLPTPYICGADPQTKLKIGSSHAWVFDSDKAKVGFLEFTGQGLGALVTAMEEKERQMAVLGARMLEGQKAGVEAAETVKIRQMGDVFTLAGVNASVADGLELALSYADRWLGGSGTEAEVTPNTDFIDFTIAAQEITALVTALQADAISLDTFLWNLKRGERMSGEIEDEKKLIEKQKKDKQDAFSNPGNLPALTPEERTKLGLPPGPGPAKPSFGNKKENV